MVHVYIAIYLFVTGHFQSHIKKLGPGLKTGIFSLIFGAHFIGIFQARVMKHRLRLLKVS